MQIARTRHPHQVMLTYLILLLALPGYRRCVLWGQGEEISSAAQAELKRRPRLPPDELKKEVAAYGGTEPSNEAVPQEKTAEFTMKECECQPSGELRCKEELVGFSPGAFTHPRLQEFTHSLATLLKLHEPMEETRVFRFIKTIGQTDGLENRGVCCWENLVKAENDCASIMPTADPQQRLDEKLLGLARACIMRKALEREFRDPNLVLPQDWPTSADDIETGGLTGSSYRKVTVEIWIKGGC